MNPLSSLVSHIKTPKKNGAKETTQVSSIQDVVAPQKIEVDFDFFKVNNKFFRTLFVAGYPRFVYPGWLDSVINFDHSLDLSFFIYPVEGKSVLDELRRKITEMEAEIATDLQRGKVINPSTQVRLEDARSIQDQLVKGAERFFQFSFYVTIPANSIEELNNITAQVESTLGSLLVVARQARLRMEDGFLTSVPLGIDKLAIMRNMDTTSLSTTFPFSSTELSSDRGVLYGINEDNDSLVVFDRFGLENYNSILLATSGSGKSFSVKLEALRSLMLGVEVFIIDPEQEYKKLTEAVSGEFISFSFNSSAKINPFDLSTLRHPSTSLRTSAQGELSAEVENQLALKILSLHSLFGVMMGKLNPSEQALLDRALVATYKAKGITTSQTQARQPDGQAKQPPLMEDLYKTLLGMEDPIGRSLADRLEKFVKGSFRGIFDQHTNINLDNPFTVFSVRDLEESLRPIAMFIILDFIWTRVKQDLKKRILIVDEAWHMMRYPDTAQFLYSVAKRSRKYWLGLTTITQDVEDFLSLDIGRAIVTNSALRLLMKQSPAAIDKVGEVFKLSEGEKQLLLSADVGEGIFFAGANHVAIRVAASDQEYKLITSKPADLKEDKDIETDTDKEARNNIQTRADAQVSSVPPVVSNTESSTPTPVVSNNKPPVNKPVFLVEEQEG
ncbi:MAG: ATP-binding protein [Candidatus Blackburnbacteria bacterium]|nr:ATP-binding protein [Candidatus Blackburnbacteria bacterium]